LDNFVDQKTIEHIVGLIDSAIKVHTDHADEIPYMEEMYGKERFQESCQKVVIQLPRRYGHTVSALEIIKNRPSALMVGVNAQVREHHSRYPDLAENILNLDTALKRNGVHPLVVLGKLAKIDCIILDSIPIAPHHVRELHDIYSPKIMVFLGDTRIVG